jgi:hypothetical protein
LLACLLIKKRRAIPQIFKVAICNLRTGEFESFKPDETADCVSGAKFYNCMGSKAPSFI